MCIRKMVIWGGALKHFHNAYDAVLITSNKKFQADALIRIVEVYFSNGEIDRRSFSEN